MEKGKVPTQGSYGKGAAGAKDARPGSKDQDRVKG